MNIRIAISVALALASGTIYASNIIRTSAPIQQGESWSDGPKVLGAWITTDRQCSAWSPSTSTPEIPFSQGQSCDWSQVRTVQETQISSSGQTRPKGDPSSEEQTILAAEMLHRTYLISNSAWIDGVVSCGTWSPDPATVAVDQEFTQTGSNCEVEQVRTVTESLKNTGDADFSVALTKSETQHLTNQSRTRNSIGTKVQANDYLKVLNAVPGVNGIYTIDSGAKGTFPAYVDMTTDGGYWILAVNFTTAVPSSANGRLHRDIDVKGLPIRGYTSSAATYPIIKDGTINTAEYGMLKNGNATWTNRYGSWQVMSTFEPAFVFSQAGFPVRTSTGDTKTMWHKGGGWSTTEVASGGYDYFGFNMTWGNSGPCGGAGVTGSKVCPYLFTSYAYHFDYTAQKQYFLKANIIE